MFFVEVNRFMLIFSEGKGLPRGGWFVLAQKLRACGIELQERMLDAFKVKDG